MLGGKPFPYSDEYVIAAVLIVRSDPTAEASFAAILARSKFGIAIAAMIRIGIKPTTPRYPSTSPAVAIPRPASRPADLPISDSER